MKVFEKTVVEVIRFGAEDIITTSDGINLPEDEI